MFHFFSLSPFPSQGPPPLPSGPKLENIGSEDARGVQMPPDVRAVTTHHSEGKMTKKGRELAYG